MSPRRPPSARTNAPKNRLRQHGQETPKIPAMVTLALNADPALGALGVSAQDAHKKPGRNSRAESPSSLPLGRQRKRCGTRELGAILPCPPTAPRGHAPCRYGCAFWDTRAGRVAPRAVDPSRSRRAARPSATRSRHVNRPCRYEPGTPGVPERRTTSRESEDESWMPPPTSSSPSVKR